MKIFSLKRIIGLAAIGGAVAYARKHGGFQNAFSDLKVKANDLIAKGKEQLAANKPAESGVGAVGGSSYTGSVGGSSVGSNNLDDFGTTSGGYGYRR